MFTSGSTGTPKGVPISYSNLAAYVEGVTGLLAIPEGARFSQFFDLSFDLSMHDIFVSMRHRGTLVAPTAVDMMMPGAYVARERIDAWFSVPLVGAQLGAGKLREDFPGFRSMLFCGEALPMETVAACRPWLAAGGRMWNLYGPTEATIAFTAADVTESVRADGNASIGRPFGVNRTAMLAADGTVVDQPQLGDEGELLLGGPQVFAGYSTDAPSPFVEGTSTRWYRSGDLVRIDDEGVYFRGRVDSQVKFRGYRIELGEIETVARRTFGLKTVAVVVSGEGVDARLVLFHLTGEAAGAIDLQRLGTDLPSYMIPAEAMALDAMPTNQNGKIDRRALAARPRGT
jgi:non-ribosomal peptide synthetase component F